MKVGAVGALSGVAEYEKCRERVPIPPRCCCRRRTACRAVAESPGLHQLFDRIGWQLRSLRVHLLLATQSLQTGGVLMTN